ncbi:MAG TPA: flagellar biosynthesis anti-sigma factor FlgM [Polyangiaceae bacterium]|nr:flagellar biosynthesis anti-sigma factor FlgM [Polyangiaceae bacterium]HMR77229.1 flagellar biosynthesis anti-sigma factor FlgM [Polyangiaceae bacterium]
MKGITGNPALDAYHRMAVSPVGEARPAAKVDAEQSQAPAEAAKVSISAEARELAAGGVGGGVDAQKVEALKARIDEGSFQIDPQKIAGRILDELG